MGCKNEDFHKRNFKILLIFAQNREGMGGSYEYPQSMFGERDGLVVNASDSGSRGRGLEPHSGQTHLLPKKYW